MRIAILTMPSHVYANHVLKALLESFPTEIVAIFESSVMSNGRPFFPALSRFWRVSGPEYVFWQGLKQTIFRIGSGLNGLKGSADPDGLFYSYQRMAKAANIPIFHSSDINQASDLERIHGLRPDVIVSVFFTQVVRQPLLSLPPLGCINIHPAYLPSYRGVSPAFWTLANGEPFSGVTVHCMDEGVDTGRILARERVPIAPDDTEHSLYMKSAKAGAPLLVGILRELRGGKRPGELAEAGQEGAASDVKAFYLSLPTRAAVASYRQGGRPFFRWCDWWAA